MAQSNDDHEPLEPEVLPYDDYQQVLSKLSNAELLGAVDLTLLELENPTTPVVPL